MKASALAPDETTVFVLLAAGRGRRFGRQNKLHAQLGDKPLWRWAAGAAESAGFATRFLIVAPGMPDETWAGAEGWTVVINPDADHGIGTSIRLAADLARNFGRMVIGLADMPFIESEHLLALANAKHTAFTEYAMGQPGVPAAFRNEDLNKLASLRGDRGAGAIEWPEASLVAVDAESLRDIDTTEDLAFARAVLGHDRI